jgi:N-acetylglucosaminyl-diphospho-decaprenol L-rhamnosyltransferase
MPGGRLPPAVDLAVSIVSYRTPDLLASCLKAVQQQRADLHLDVTVVDNASGDGSADLVAERFPWVHLIRNPRNVGFGAAHNQTLRQAAAQARHLLVLNADAAPRPDSLRRLVDFLDAHPDVSVVGPRLRYPDGQTQPSRRRFPVPLTLFLESTQAQRFWPDNRVLRHYYVAERSDDQTQDVDWLVGACLCVRAEAARQVGVFDERFFLYSEELDWCRRFRAAGWRVVYYPEAEVVHLEGASTRLDLAARDRHFQASKLRYAQTWHGWPAATALRAYLVLEYLARGVEEGARLAQRSRVEQRRARLQVIASGLRSVLRA